AEARLRRHLRDRQSWALRARRGHVVALLRSAAGAVIDTGLVVEAARINVSLGDRVAGRAVQRRARSQRRAVGRHADEVTDLRIGDRLRRQRRVATVLYPLSLLDALPICAEARLRRHLRDRQSWALRARRGH